MGNYPELRNALNSFRELFSRRILAPGVVNHSKKFLNDIKIMEEWSVSDAFRVYQIIKPYTRLLKDIGFDFEQVPAIKMEVAKVQDNNPKIRSIGYVGDQFVIRFPYNPQIVQDIHAFEGRQWHAESKTWTVPLSQAEQVRQFAMGNNFQVGDGAMAMFNGIDQNLDMSYSAKRVELFLDLNPEMTLFDFQTVGADYIMRNRNVIIGDQMGLGKTIEVIAGVVGTDEFPCLVVCPKSLRYNWKDEWERWTTKKVLIIDKKNVRMLPRFIELGMCDVAITNFEGVRTHFTEKVVDVDITAGAYAGRSYKKAYINELPALFKSGILDEGHECRNRKTIRFKTVKATFLNMNVRLALTGTPIVKGSGDIASLLEIIGRIEEFGGRRKFMGQYTNMNKQSFDSRQKATSTNLKDLNIKLRTTCFIRREKYQVLKELPEKFRQIIRVDLDNRAEYDHALFSLQDWMVKNNYDPERISAAMRAEMLVKVNYLKQISGRGKLSALKEFIQNVHDAGEKIVIAVWFKATAKYIRDNFDNVLLITGDLDDQRVTDEDIDRNKRLFQNDPKYKTLVASYKRGGVGHTLTAASKIAMIELGWTYKDQVQMEDRCLVPNSLVYCLRSVYLGGMGLVKIKDIKVGDTVLTHLGNEKKVIDVFSKGHRGLMTDIQYVGWHEPLTCTHDHKLLVKSGNDIVWKEAHLLLPTDAMALPKRKHFTDLDIVNIKKEWRLYESIEKKTICVVAGCKNKVYSREMCKSHYRSMLKSNAPRPPKPPVVNSRYVRLPDTIVIDSDWLYLFGFYVAEGFSSLLPGKSKFVSFSAHEKEKPILKKIAKKIEALGVKCSIYKGSDGGKGIEMRCYSGELAFWFRDWFGHGARNKTLPSELMNLPPVQAALFLKGYVDGDGYMRKKQTEWVTASEQLCYQMCIIAVRAGHIPTMRRIKTKLGNPHWVGGYTKFSKATRLQDQDDDYVFRPIRRVETYYAEIRVYDITIEDDHSFVTGFATAHNCHRISQEDTVNCYYFLGNDTIDEDIYDIIESRRQMEKDATGGTEEIETKTFSALGKLLHEKAAQNMAEQAS